MGGGVYWTYLHSCVLYHIVGVCNTLQIIIDVINDLILREVNLIQFLKEYVLFLISIV